VSVADPPRTEREDPWVLPRRRPRHAASGRTLRSGDLLVHRVLTLLAAISLFGAAIATSGPVIQLPLIGLISIVGFGAVLAAVAMTLLCRSEEALRRVDLVILALALVLLAAWAASDLYGDPVYGTDESAFVQYSALLLQHGRDPYAVSMLPSLTQYQVPIQYATYLLNGGISSTFAYPALSFLLVVPFDVLTNGVQSIIVTNIFFLAAELVIVFVVLPRHLRGLATVLVMGLPILFGYTAGGVVATMFVPFLLIVAYRWTDIGRNGILARRGIAQALCLGLAVSVSQFPWFLVPFLLVGVWCLRESEIGARRAGVVTAKFAGLAGATALVVNAPFIAWDPGAWVRGITTPVLQHAIPFGQGLVAASVFFRVGGGNLAYYTDGAMVLFVALLITYGLWIRRLWRLTFVLPSLVLYFPSRSLTEYAVSVIALWTVSIVVPGRGPLPEAEALSRVRDDDAASAGGDLRRHRSRLALLLVSGVALVAAGVLLTLALVTPAPLRLRILSVTTNGQFERVWEINVAVKNQSTSPVEPHFTAHSTSQLTPYWDISRGPTRLGAGESASYTLIAPNVGSMPIITQPFVLQAVTPVPESISSSAAYTPQAYTCYITPSYVDQTLPLGSSVSLEVELRSPLGAQVHRRGVPVALGQVIYGQDALIPAEAQINGASEGKTAVVALTGADGVARFHVRDSSLQGSNPIYFQAFVQPPGSFPYGYSEVVTIVWRPRR